MWAFLCLVLFVFGAGTRLRRAGGRRLRRAGGMRLRLFEAVRLRLVEAVRLRCVGGMRVFLKARIACRVGFARRWYEEPC